MHDVAVAFEDHQVLDRHAAEFADAAQVVAGEVHEHDVLGPLLGIGQQFRAQGGVFRLRLSARPRAGDGPDFHPAILAPHMGFGRSAHEGESLQFEQEHIRRRIDRSGRRDKCPAAAAWTGVEKRCEPTTWMMSPAVMYCWARETFRKNTSFGMLETKGISGTSCGNIHGDVVGRLFQQGNQPLDFARRVLVGLLRAAFPVQRGVDQDGDGLGHAVENQQLVRDEKIHGRRAQVVARRARDDRLDVVYKFIADKADRAAGEAGQAGPGNRLETPHDLFDHG